MGEDDHDEEEEEDEEEDDDDDDHGDADWERQEPLPPRSFAYH